MNNTKHRELAIAVIEAELRSKLAGIHDTEEMLKLAFREVQNHHMFSNDEDQFAGALGAVLMRLGKDHPDYEKLSESIGEQRKVVGVFTALQSGVPVDLERMAEEAKTPPYLLNKMWMRAMDEVKKGVK